MPKGPKDRKISLHKALKVGYLRNEDKQAKALKRFGYQLDRRISDGRETMVAFNPIENKVLFVSNGTDPKSGDDLATDMILGLGGVDLTKRYARTKRSYEMAKDKYKGAQFVDAGHSLGGGIVNELVDKRDKAYTYNPAIFTGRAKSNVENYRTQGDVFSLFAPNETTKQLVNPSNTVRPLNYILKTHQVDNIKNLPVFL